MAAVTHSFDDALGYEQFMGRWSRPLGQAFLQWLSLPSDMQWLDIGCGTGIFTRLILGACSPAAVVGIDCAKEPIEHARQSVSSRPWCFDPRPMVTVAICAARTGNRFGPQIHVRPVALRPVGCFPVIKSPSLVARHRTCETRVPVIPTYKSEAGVLLRVSAHGRADWQRSTHASVSRVAPGSSACSSRGGSATWFAAPPDDRHLKSISREASIAIECWS
jgi:hypothetical protein